MTSTRSHVRRLCLLVVLSACLGDPTGPAGLRVGLEAASADTVVGAPGEPVQPAIRLFIADAVGTPISGASVAWSALGQNASALGPTVTDGQGKTETVWVLGTDGAEAQQLTATVTHGGQTAQLVVHARAVPHVVSQLRLALDTPAVLRLGDTLRIHVNAIDPYGNVFPAPDVTSSLGDSGLGTVAGASVIGGRRGRTVVQVASHGVTAAFPLHITQYVSAVVPTSDTIAFSAVGAERPIVYTVRDDRGRIVADTTAAISIADSTKVRVNGGLVRSLAPGATALNLTLGPAAATIVVGVRQRVASITLERDTVRFDALSDTTTLHPVARDSLNSDILQPVLSYGVSDEHVAKFVSGSTLTAAAPGTMVVTVRDSATGIAATAHVLVHQRIAAIELPAAAIQFDAIGDTATLSPVARDRLGSPVVGAALEYSVSDPTVVGLQAGRRLGSIHDGRAVVTTRDPESGTVATTTVTVAQRTTALSLTADSLTFTAVGDTVPVAFVAQDRLGVPVASAIVAYSSSDSNVATVTTDGRIRSLRNGAALVVGRSADGPADTAYVTVAQQVAAITLPQDSMTFGSLHAVQQAHATPVDRRGVAIPTASLTFTSENPAVAGVDETGHVRAMSNGTTHMLVASMGDTARLSVLVAQRPVRVNVPADTIRLQSFGDSAALTGVAVDSLGSPVAGGVSAVAVGDTTIVAPAELLMVRARGNGVTQAKLTVAGITGQVVIVVDQVTTALTVTVDSSKPIVTLPAGATLPLACAAFDRNGFPIVGRSTLARSVRGTVAGTDCTDTRIQRSGYDTLVFASGAIQTRIPVVVSTGDSLGVVGGSHPIVTQGSGSGPLLGGAVFSLSPPTTTQRDTYTGEDLANPLVLALRPLVNEILAAYGNPTSNLDRARAIRDWMARTAVHPHPPLHPNGSTANLGVLPPGKTWADINALIFAPSKDSLLSANVAYWGSVGFDGYAMLNRLLGTLDPATGLRANDGMMVRVAAARYQIRDLRTYRYPICTYQSIMMSALWEAAGLQGMLISTWQHDPAAVFIPELGRWVYEDATFNEEYLLDGAGDPLSPADLLALSSAGQNGRLRATKVVTPNFDSQVYIGVESYVKEHPAGMVIMGSQLNNRNVGVGGWPVRLVQIDVPQLAQYAPFNNTVIYDPVQPTVAFPTLGAGVQQVQLQDSVYVSSLVSTLPNHQHFERRVNSGAWATVSSTDVLPVGQCRVEYRSVDAVGSTGASVAVDVWTPRAPGFVESGTPGGFRAQSRYCTLESS